MNTNSPTDEIHTKRRRLEAFLDRHDLDAVLLTRRGNFAWITGGRDNHIVNGSDVGFVSILVTAEKSICLADTIESPRMEKEELPGTDVSVVSFPWWDSAAKRAAVSEVIGWRRVAADVDPFGLDLPHLPEEFGELRWALTDAEISRYRNGGSRASAAMEAACQAIEPGMSEFEIAGVLDNEVRRRGSKPVVTLVAVDERIRQFRHPIPTQTKLARHAMLVTCAESGGLISNLTRFVHFGPLPADLRARHHAVCDVDAAVNLATRPGRTLGEIFADLQSAYAAAGFADEWKLHHQGGSTGYAGRDVLGTPGCAVKVLANQAFAWNPSITGTKSEDTAIVTDAGIEVITAASDRWPTVVGRSVRGELVRADVLVR